MADAINIKVKVNPNFTGAGLAGSLSWQRLEQILRDAGELKDNEVINGYRADKQGINFYIDYRGVNNP